MNNPIKNPENGRRSPEDRLITITAILIGLSLLLLVLFSVAQEKPGHLKPLKRGESLPELRLANVLNMKSPVLESSHFKGKLLILAFWSTHCSSSAEELLRFDALQKEFPGILILGVTSQSREEIQYYLRQRARLSTISLPILTSDTLLQQLFPHQTVPHLVWLDKAGRYRAATYAEYLNAATIREALNGRGMNWPQKEDKAAYDYSRSLLSLSSPATGTPFYTVLAGHVPGASTREGFVPDSARATRRYYAINHSILHLYAMGYGRGGLIFTPSRRILEVRDPGKYEYHTPLGYRQEWERNNLYSYETLLPLATSPQEVYRKLRQDLDAMLGLHTSIETRKVKVLVLQKAGAKSPAPSAYGKTEIALGASEKKPFMHRATLDNLVIALNRIPGYPPVLDESGIRAPLDLDFQQPLTDLRALRQALATQGLFLTPQQRDIELFVLRETSVNSPPSLTH